MKYRILKPIEVEIATLKVRIPDISSWEDWPVNNAECEGGVGHPLFDGENGIEFTVDINTGKIEGWPEGITMETWDKVRDEGIYELYSDKGECECRLEYEYVPSVFDTRGDGYGDYMQFEVDSDGVIRDWNPRDLQKLLDVYYNS